VPVSRRPLHNAGHAAAGLWGLLVYRRRGAALAYVRALAALAAVAAHFGFVKRA
jgi:hypothetical protein